MHAGQLEVSVETVRRLVADQFPGWGGLPVREVAGNGTVNAIFRLGERLTARFPLVPDEHARRTIEREAVAAAELAGCTRFPTPEPVALLRER